MNYIDIKQTTKDLIKWIKDYFDNNGNENTLAIVGISGGKDSLVVAALCAAALGKERVLGIQMPDGDQADIKDSNMVFDLLGIRRMRVNIGDITKSFYQAIGEFASNDSAITTNTPARIRMSVLYAIGARYNGRVACTSNASEAYVGYSTKWGDNVGDFAPLRNLTTQEICDIGIELGLPHALVFKTPSDGMSGLSDEDKLGFKYRDVNIILRDGSIKNINNQAFCDITMKHAIAQHKLNTIPMFEPNLIEGD